MTPVDIPCKEQAGDQLDPLVSACIHSIRRANRVGNVSIRGDTPFKTGHRGKSAGSTIASLWSCLPVSCLPFRPVSAYNLNRESAFMGSLDFPELLIVVSLVAILVWAGFNWKHRPHVR